MHPLPATITIAEANAAVRALAQVQPSPGGVLELDAAALSSFDSSAIAVLLDVRRRAQRVGARVRVHHAPAAMVELAQLYGVRDLLGFEAPRT